jgi:hypothetical protein
MFTLQSGQIENALRGMGANDASAKQMVQSLANCNQPITHRSQLSLSNQQPNLFPTLPPASPTEIYPFVQMGDTRQIFINIPPWQNIPFTPIPYPEWPEWKNSDFAGPPVLIVDGPARTGPVSTPSVDAGDVRSENITNEGDLISYGDQLQEGDVFIGGNVQIAKHVRHGGNVVNNGPVINNRFVINRHDTFNQISRNYITHNYGPTYNYAETHLDGPVYIDGQEAVPTTMDVVTGVTWDGSAFRATTKQILTLARVLDEGEATILDCTA